MKPLLIIGLGNSLMGDDGVGCAVTERLAQDPRLAEEAEVLCGGTDLLRFSGEMHGRRRVVAIDAVQDGREPGTVCELQTDDPALHMREEHAHALSAVAAIRLLRMVVPARYTLLGISIPSASAGTHMSGALQARLPEIVDSIIEYLSE
jgi:hydrogenase maturation protease